MICILFGHKWDGCKCLRCGKKRDEQHDWDGCEYRHCGKLRHDFDSDNVCTLCKAQLVTEIEEVVTYQPCTGCPAGNGYGCTGDTSTCIAQDDYRIVESVESTYIVFPDGKKEIYKKRTLG